MTRTDSRRDVRINFNSTDKELFVNSALSKAPVAGLTHSYYKYPARFSPEFAKTAIELFTKPGDTVLDPFMGGGTTLIEAFALNRRAVGSDISTLAEFVSQAKTTILSERQIDELKRWYAKAFSKLNIQKPVNRPEVWIERGYQRNLDGSNVWRIRKLVEQALDASGKLNDDEQLRLARCLVLKTAQWALDGRKEIAGTTEFKNKLDENFHAMLEAHQDLKDKIDYKRNAPICLNIPAEELINSKVWNKLDKPKLILTSPPYPGVHILYHRWQIDGGKETPAPFWIANKLDGAGLSYYTMGDRKQNELTTYYEKAAQIFSGLRKLCTARTTVVQMIAFSEPEWQLPKYLEMMNRCGFSEQTIPGMNSKDSRLWRDVPNRKWYAQQKGATHSSKEVVLVHAPKR